MSSAPAVTAAARSTSRRSPRSCGRGGRAGRQAREPGREQSLRLGRRAGGARRSDRPRRRGRGTLHRRGGHRIPVRARVPPVDGPRRARSAASSGCRRCSTSWGRSPTRRGPTAQAVGCSDPRMLPLMAEVLARRGTRAMLFRGEDGLDELTTTGRLDRLRRARRAGPRDGIWIPPSWVWLGPPSRTCSGGDARRRRPSSGPSSPASPGRERDVVLLNAGRRLGGGGRSRLDRGRPRAGRAAIDSGAASRDARALDRGQRLAGVRDRNR